MLQGKLSTLQTLEDLPHPLSVVLWLVLQFYLRSLNREERELQCELEES